MSQHRLSAVSPLLLMRNVALQPGEVCRFGRDSESCDVVVAGPLVSRCHASVLLDGGQVVVRDEGSSNGTFVNGDPIGRDARTLQAGDTLALGSPDGIHFSYLVDRDFRQTEWIPDFAHGPIVIGSDAACSICLTGDQQVATKHLQIDKVGEKIVATAIGDNAFSVNGHRGKRIDLGAFDILNVGGSTLAVEIGIDGQVSLHLLEQSEGLGSRLEGVGLDVTVARDKKLLSDVTAAILPGELVAVLGPSGSGKTTFIKTLCGIQAASAGEVFFDGVAVSKNPGLLTEKLGFVPQDDIVLPELTVRQSLDYMARLRLAQSRLRRDDRRALVDTIIATLGLTPFADTPVKRLSGGQRKRVSIGIELITRPGLLCLDEPTAALDPASEELLIRHFRSLADHGTTVVMTTHVLYSLDAFDKIIFIVDGKLAFHGTPDEALAYFSDYYQKPLQRHLDIFREIEGERLDGSASGLGSKMERLFRDSDVYQINTVAALSRNARRLFHAGPSRPAGKRGRQWLRDLRLRPNTIITLASRHARSRLGSLARVAIYALVPACLALATLLLGSPQDTTELQQQADQRFEQLFSVQTSRWNAAFTSLLERFGSPPDAEPASAMHALLFENPGSLPVSIGKLLMFCLTALFGGALVACTEIASERPLLQRESITSYGMLEYLVSKLPVLALIAVGQMAIYLGICLAFSDEFQAINLYATFALLVALSACAMMLGLLVSATDFSSGRTAVIVVLALLLPQLILSGGLAPDFYRGASSTTQTLMDLLPARWGFEGFLNTTLASQGTPQDWIVRVVDEVMGFDLSTQTLTKDFIVIGLQGLLWFILACSVLVFTRGKA